MGSEMKVYLSGKITGDAVYRQKFEAVEKELLSYGYVVFNPAVLPDEFEYEDYMSLDLLMLSRCDAIFLLRDWKTSPGARREYEEAKRLGLKVLDEEAVKIRRTLKQICEDTSSIIKGQMDCEENRIWAREKKALTIEIQNRLKNFDLSVGEEENLLQMYESFDVEKKRLFYEEFIADSDKLIEYDLMEKMEGDDFEEKIRLSQVYKISADIMALIEAQTVELQTA